MPTAPHRYRRALVATLGAGILAVGMVVAAPSPAEAWWRGGFYFGGPAFYVGPPVFYPPPVVYAQPPVVYAPPPVTYTPAPPYSAQSCVAGPYVCPLPRPFAEGSGCSCFDNSGRRIYGQAR
jgi:hypothetical protein